MMSSLRYLFFLHQADLFGARAASSQGAMHHSGVNNHLTLPAMVGFFVLKILNLGEVSAPGSELRKGFLGGKKHPALWTAAFYKVLESHIQGPIRAGAYTDHPGVKSHTDA